MKVSIRPSGDSAGEVAESVKFVSCTQSERVATGGLKPRQSANVTARSRMNNIAAATQTERRLLIGRDGAGDPARPDVVLCFSRLKSVRSSAAVWQRMCRSFSKAFSTTGLNSTGKREGSAG